MANGTALLQQLPEPGAAIFPQNQSTSRIELVMQSNSTYTTWTINFADGRPFLKVKSPFVTMSSRKEFIDANTGEKLCDLRTKKVGGATTYSAHAPNVSTPLLEIKNKDLNSEFWSDGSRYETIVKFTDAATGMPEELSLRGDTSRNILNPLFCRGLCCGFIDEKFIDGKRQYLLYVAPRLDPFLVAVMAVNLDKKEKEDPNKALSGRGILQSMTGAPAPIYK